MQLLRSPWDKTFADFSRTIKFDAILVAPYIGVAPIRQLGAALNRENPPRIDLVTSFELDSLLHGSVAVEAIADLSRELPTVTVRHLPSLHAKVYVADESLAIITSGNLTQSSLRVNREFGVRFTKPSIVRQIAAEMRSYASHGAVISTEKLDALAEKLQPLREKYRETIYNSKHPDSRALQEILEGTRQTLTEITGESETAVFARTILEILKCGPLSTKEMHPIIKELHPDLCQDGVFRTIGTHRSTRWKHMVRSAQRHLKRRGNISNTDGKWHLL